MNLLDVVALTAPAGKLPAGAVGTIIEVFEQGCFLVEFVDDEGRTVALETVGQNCLLKLRYDLAQEPTASRSVTAGMSDAEFEAWLVTQGAVPMFEERRRSLNLDGSGAL